MAEVLKLLSQRVGALGLSSLFSTMLVFSLGSFELSPVSMSSPYGRVSSRSGLIVFFNSSIFGSESSPYGRVSSRSVFILGAGVLSSAVWLFCCLSVCLMLSYVILGWRLPQTHRVP